jgi:hypothetical protein
MVVKSTENSEDIYKPILGLKSIIIYFLQI